MVGDLFDREPDIFEQAPERCVGEQSDMPRCLQQSIVFTKAAGHAAVEIGRPQNQMSAGFQHPPHILNRWDRVRDVFDH